LPKIPKKNAKKRGNLFKPLTERVKSLPSDKKVETPIAPMK